MAKSENVLFKASPEQLKFAELYLDLDCKKTQKELAKDVKVADRTIRRWFEDKDFVTWLNSKKDEILNKSLMARYRIAIRKASIGDFQFSKLLFEMTGDYTQKTETKVTNVYEEFKNLSDEELINDFANDLDRYRASTADRKINPLKKT